MSVAAVPGGPISTPLYADGSSLIVPGGDPLSIGGVIFASIECPTELAFGVEQRTVTKEKIGGGRDVQRLGPQPKDIAWSGVFYQPNVDSRVTALRAMAVSGTEVQITWHTESWFGIVVDFTPKYNNTNKCPYEIKVLVTRAGNGALTPASIPTSVDSQVSALASNAQSQAAAIVSNDETAATTIGASMTSMQSTLTQYGPVSQLIGGNLGAVLTSIQAALSATNTYIGLQPSGSTAWLAASQLQGTLTLLQMNVQNGQGIASTVAQGASMMALSAQQYGDVSQFLKLASANGLDSPFSSRLIASPIVFPPFTPSL